MSSFNLYPSIQVSSSFAVSSSLSLVSANTPISASLAGYALNNPGPQGPTITVTATLTQL